MIGHADHGDFGFVAVERNAGDDGLFHFFVFLECDKRAVAFFLKAGQHPQFDFVFAGELDRAELQHLGTETRHFQHFLEGNGFEPARFGHDAGIGGVDAVDIGIDLALVGLERSRQCNAGGVGSATTQRGDVAFFVDTLKAGHHNHVTGIQVAAHIGFVDAEDACLGVGIIGEDADLRAGVAFGFQP